MKTLLLRAVALIQIVLGLLYLFAPGWMTASMGHSPLPADLAYPLAMLAARFLAYGAGIWASASDPLGNARWVRLMALIQAIDLAAGVAYTALGVVPLALSGFPMFNAAWIAGVCLWAAREPRLPLAPARRAGVPG